MELLKFAELGVGIFTIVILAYALKILFQKFDEANKRCEANALAASERHEAERDKLYDAHEKHTETLNTTLIGLTAVIDKSNNRRRNGDK